MLLLMLLLSLFYKNPHFMSCPVLSWRPPKLTNQASNRSSKRYSFTKINVQCRPTFGKSIYL